MHTEDFTTCLVRCYLYALFFRCSCWYYMRTHLECANTRARALNRSTRDGYMWVHTTFGAPCFYTYLHAARALVCTSSLGVFCTLVYCPNDVLTTCTQGTCELYCKFWFSILGSKVSEWFIADINAQLLTCTTMYTSFCAVCFALHGY